MRLTLFHCLILLASPSIARTAGAVQTSDDIAQLETGIICAPPSAGEQVAPDTLAGTTHLIDDEPDFVSRSHRVPAVVGIGFGVKSLATDVFGVSDITMTVTHPPMGKDGVTTQTFQTRIDGIDPSLTFYQFDFTYELVEGPWQMEATKGGKVLYTATFEVVSPTAVPALAKVCGFEDLLS